MSQELFAAARLGDLETLLKHRDQLLADFDDYPYRVWLAGFETDQVGVLDLCLECGLEPDGTPETRPIVQAAVLQARNCVDRLLQRGANPALPDEDGRNLLYVALGNGDLEFAKIALDGGASPFGEDIDFFLSVAPKPVAESVRTYRKQVSVQFARHRQAAKAIRRGEDFDPNLTPEEVNAPIPTERGATLLHVAAKANRPEAIRRLVALGGVPDVLDRTIHERRYGRGTVLELSAVIGTRTPLMTACESGCGDAVAALIELGADVNVRDGRGETALHLACRGGKASIVRALIEAGANPNALTEEGAAPLLIAGYFGSEEVARALIGSGAEIDRSDDEGFTPILAACWEGKTEVALALLEAGANLNASAGQEGDVWDALHTERRTKTLKRLLPYLDLNPQDRSESPLATAAQCFHHAAIPAMIEAGARLKPGERVNLVDAWGVEPKVQRAAIEAMAKLAGPPDPEQVVRAARADDLKLVRSLVEMGADPSPAIAQDLRVRMIKLLLELGARIDQQDEQGRTALAWATLHEKPEAVNLLLSKGADPYLADHVGDRPVDLAQLCSKAVRELYSRLEPDPRRVATLRLIRLFSDYGPPPLGEVVEALQAGADPDSTVGRGFDLLSVAAANRWWEIADELLSSRATPTWMSDTFLAIRNLPNRVDDAFRAQVAQIEQALGEEATPIEGGFGAVSFSLKAQVAAMRDKLMAEGHNATVADLRASMDTARIVAESRGPGFKAGWCGPWRSHPVADDRLICVPTPNPYEVVALIQPRAGEHDIGVFEILAFLRKQEPLGWQLIGIGYDTVDLEFSQLPSDIDAFAKELYDFCPDLIDQGFESQEALAQHLLSTKRVHFWWD